MTTTFDGLRDIIVRDFELASERLRRDTALEEIELDSLAITELVFALEDEFHVTAGNVNPSFKNLGDIADYIDRLIVERDAAPKASHAAASDGAASAKSAPAARAKSTSATRASAAKTSRSARNGAKARAPKRDAANGAHGANGHGARSTDAANSGTPPRKRKRANATTGGARPR